MVHLGFRLHYTLSDIEDVKRATLEMCRKANCMLQSFSSCDSTVKTKLFSSHCLSLYGASLWKLDCSQIKSLEVSFNNVLRKIWALPRRCHTRILHSVACLTSVWNRIFSLSSNLVKRASESDSVIVRDVFLHCCNLAYTPIGYNN